MIPTKETIYFKFRLAVLTKDVVGVLGVIREAGSVFWVETHVRVVRNAGLPRKWIKSKDETRWCLGLGSRGTVNIQDCREPTEEEIQVHVALEISKLIHKYYPKANHDCGMVAMDAVFPKMHDKGWKKAILSKSITDSMGVVYNPGYVFRYLSDSYDKVSGLYQCNIEGLPGIPKEYFVDSRW